MKLLISSLAFALFTGLAQAQPAAPSPHPHFQASLKALAEKDYDRAAVEIRQGEALVERAAARAESEARVALDAAANELRSLALDVESGVTHDAQALRSAFARAEHALRRTSDGQADETSPFDAGA